MWSFLSKGLNKELSKYEINEIVEQPDENCIWAMHKGKVKASGDDVSVFVFENKGHTEYEIKAARNAFKRIKMLRHPGILNYLDGFENDSCIYIITPMVQKLTKILYSKSSETLNKVANSKFSTNDWGLFKLANLLSFLNGDCNLVHNNINPHALFCDKGGEWKLFGFEYTYLFTDEDSMKTKCLKPKSLRIYEPPEFTNGYGGVNVGSIWSTDIWGFACLIWEISNGKLVKRTMLKDTSQLPKKLVPLYCEMMNSNPGARLSPAKFLEKSRSSTAGYLNNPCLSAMIFLDEIQMKDSAEKKKFFTATLPPLLDSFSPDICKFKILPQIVQAFDYCEAGTAILPALIKLGQTISDDQLAYDKLIKPCLVKLYNLPDRHTRITLLNSLPEYYSCLTPATVNDQLFGNIVTGFLDTNPLVKEATIKGMVYLAPKLNYNNLNLELVKYFARLQGTDPHGGIRTNTTVCMGKIAKYFDPKIRQKILVSAFTRPFRDDFPACRKAGLQAISATSELYVSKDIGEKVLPPLCCLTVDPDKSIRDMAFDVIKDYLKILKDISENPEKMTEHDNHAMSSKIAEDQYVPYSPLNSTMQNAYKLGEASKIALGWVSTLTSKFYPPGSSTAGEDNTSSSIKPGDANESNSDLVSGDIITTTSNFNSAQKTFKSTLVDQKNRESSDANNDFYDSEVPQPMSLESNGAVVLNEEGDAWEDLEESILNTKTESFFTAYADRHKTETGKKGHFVNGNDGDNKGLINFDEDDWWKSASRGDKSKNPGNLKRPTTGGGAKTLNLANSMKPQKLVIDTLKGGGANQHQDRLLEEILKEENMIQKEPLKPKIKNSKDAASSFSKKSLNDSWGDWTS